MQATGVRLAPSAHGPDGIARQITPTAENLIEATTTEAAQRGEGISVIACWARPR